MQNKCGADPRWELKRTRKVPVILPESLSEALTSSRSPWNHLRVRKGKFEGRGEGRKRGEKTAWGAVRLLQGFPNVVENRLAGIGGVWVPDGAKPLENVPEVVEVDSGLPRPMLVGLCKKGAHALRISRVCVR